MSRKALFAILISSIFFTVSISGLTTEEQCAIGGKLTKIPDPNQCHTYYNCGQESYDEDNQWHFPRYMEECDFPDMFSTQTMHCEYFDNVTCGSRPEFTECTPYRRKVCSMCPPCPKGCKGQSDGYHAYAGQEWTPFYVMCYKERVNSTGFCHRDDFNQMIFHPVVNECVSLFYVPKEHGGLLPNCTDKADGAYRDNDGNLLRDCHYYLVCQNDSFKERIKCPDDLYFDVLTSSCQILENSMDPCGTKPAIRLVGGQTKGEGRVEVFNIDQWGSVLATGWDKRDADVVCKKIGYHLGGRAIHGSAFGKNVGPIWIDDVDCSGSEDTLLDCKYEGFKSFESGHNQMAGVICENTEVASEEQQCENGASIIPHPGECQLFYDCSEEVHVVDPVTGRQVDGFEPYMDECFYPDLFSTETLQCEYFGNVICGDRKEFRDCRDYRRNGTCDGCTPCETLSLSCANKPNGWNMYNNVPWDVKYIVCEEDRPININKCPTDEFSETHFHPDRRECVSLFYVPREYGGTMPDCSGKTDGFFRSQIDEDTIFCDQFIQCSNETFMDIHKCPNSLTFDILTSSCQEHKNTMIPCGAKAAIRLINGATENEGRVEVFHDEQWGTICNDIWGNIEATIVCKELGYSLGGKAVDGSAFGEGIGLIWLDNVICASQDTSVHECDSEGWGIHNCDHSKDAGVYCNLPKQESPGEDSITMPVVLGSVGMVLIIIFIIVVIICRRCPVCIKCRRRCRRTSEEDISNRPIIRDNSTGQDLVIKKFSSDNYVMETELSSEHRALPVVPPVPTQTTCQDQASSSKHSQPSDDNDSTAPFPSDDHSQTHPKERETSSNDSGCFLNGQADIFQHIDHDMSENCEEEQQEI